MSLKLLCVKAFDTEPAAARLGPMLGEATAVISLQNGVDNEDKLARAVGPDHVMGGAAFIFAGKAEPGVIVHTGGPTSITLGELDGQVTERAQRLLAQCQQAGFAAELSESIKTVLWAKFAFICAFRLAALCTCAMCRQGLGLRPEQVDIAGFVSMRVWVHRMRSGIRAESAATTRRRSRWDDRTGWGRGHHPPGTKV